MSELSIVSKETANENQAQLLNKAGQAFGFVPNLFSVLANSPAVGEAYLALSKFFENTNLNSLERQIVVLETSVCNQCEYCVAAHTVVAGMSNVPENMINAIRDNSPIDDSKLEALRKFTQAIIEQRGFVDAEEVKEFKQAGYEDKHILDVILGVAWKTISNYTNHIANTPLDKAFQKSAWKATEEA